MSRTKRQSACKTKPAQTQRVERREAAQRTVEKWSSLMCEATVELGHLDLESGCSQHIYPPVVIRNSIIPTRIDSFSIGPTPAPPTNNNNKTNELKLAWISPCPCLVRPSHGLLGNSPTFPNFRGSAYTLDRHSHGDKGPHAPPLTADTGLPYNPRV